MKTILHPVTFSVIPQLRMSGGPRFDNTYNREGVTSQTVINQDEALWEWTLQFKKGSREFGVVHGFFCGRLGGAFGWWFDDPYDRTESDNLGTGVVKQLEDGKFYLGKIYPDDYNPYFRRICCPLLETVVITGTGGNPVVDRYTGQVIGIDNEGTATFRFVNPVTFLGDFFDVERAPGNAPGDWAGVQIREIRSFTMPVYNGEDS